MARLNTSYNRLFILSSALFLAFSGTKTHSQQLPSVALVVEDNSAPEGFDFVGSYLVDSMVRIRNGKSHTITIPNTQYRVYSNGIEVRLYQSSSEGAFHSYKIYRSDGISEQDQLGNISIKPGLQARHISEDTIKQISLTQDHLTITQFPPITNTVVVTFAKRLAQRDTNR
ncbi:hypothetical protein [Rubritalea tangerina]|uniref:Uncharacterized protein n=1 Tax=Rubritalea tangerina TaxID=430798 RepID=A0ABW4Z6I2_9BACT